MERKGVRSGEQKGVTMIAVIFEVWPKPSRKQDYLNIAAELKSLLENIDGFISIERFESLYEPGERFFHFHSSVMRPR